jgi:methionyl-tRNA formyltransferase
MLAETLPEYIAGRITPVPQDHSQATFTKKIQKEDGLLYLSDNNLKNFRKIQAFNIWPRAYFFTEINGKRTRVIVTDAELREEKLIIKKILPEGKKEMDYS